MCVHVHAVWEVYEEHPLLVALYENEEYARQHAAQSKWLEYEELYVSADPPSED